MPRRSVREGGPRLGGMEEGGRPLSPFLDPEKPSQRNQNFLMRASRDKEGEGIQKQKLRPFFFSFFLPHCRRLSHHHQGRNRATQNRIGKEKGKRRRRREKERGLKIRDHFQKQSIILPLFFPRHLTPRNTHPHERRKRRMPRFSSLKTVSQPFTPSAHSILKRDR